MRSETSTILGSTDKELRVIGDMESVDKLQIKENLGSDQSTSSDDGE